MNIQRYTCPVIVAAGLHGALFLMSSERNVVVENQAIHKEPPPPPPIVESTIAMEDFTDRSEDALPAASGPVVPEIPEVAIEPLQKTEFTIAPEENLHPEKISPVKTISIAGNSGEMEGRPGVPYRARFVGVDGLDRRPRATAQMSPDYPLSLHKQGVTGTVTVEFDVDTLGRVVRAEVTNYTRREFAEPALRAVRSWRFEPGKRNGKIVPFRMAVPIEFKIDS